jgi:hypothetical protein
MAGLLSKEAISDLKKMFSGAIPDFTGAALKGYLDLDVKLKDVERSIGANTAVGGIYTQSLRESAIEVGKYNVKVDDLVQSQLKYSEITGRLNALNKEATVQIVEIGRAFGIANDKLIEFAASSESLGIGMSSIYNLTEDTMNMAQSMGLNSSKIIKSQIEFLQRESRFITFKNGLDDIKEMAIRSEQVGANVQGYTGAIDKMMTLEGAMAAASKLQMMGGDFAKLGDPIQLMYKAQNNPKQLIADLQEMTKNAATFNERTGQFEIRPEMRMAIKDMSGDLGIAADEMMNVALGQARLNKIDVELPKGLDQYRDLISGLSKIEGGRAVITMKDEITGENITKAVSDLTARDAKMLEDLQKTQGTISERAMQTMAPNERVNSIATIVENWASTGIGVRFADSKIVETLTRGGVEVTSNTMGNLDKEILTPFINKLDTLEVSIAADDFLKKFDNILSTSIKNNSLRENVSTSTVSSVNNIADKKETTPMTQGVLSGSFKLEGDKNIVLNVDGKTMAEAIAPYLITYMDERNRMGSGN